MTHAALKDRKTHVAVLTELRNDVNPEGSDPYGHMMAEALDAAIAAISAMEGEAVAYMICYPDGDKRVDLSPATCSQGATIRPLIYGDTAPPPQQAVVPQCKHANTVLGTDGVRFCNVCGAPVPVNPTPSPGPQGGGGVPDNPVPQSWIDAGGMIARISETKYGLGISFNCDAAIKVFHDFYSATPPAQQPGEVVAEQLRRELHSHDAAYSYTQYEQGRVDEKRRTLDLLTAALSTTPASGGEHG